LAIVLFIQPFSDSDYPFGGVIDSVLASSVVDRGFEPRSGQIIGYEIGICCFFTKYKALRSKSPTKRVGLVQSGKLYRLFEFNLLSPWYN